jgi:hypothetical protein
MQEAEEHKTAARVTKSKKTPLPDVTPSIKAEKKGSGDAGTWQVGHGVVDTHMGLDMNVGICGIQALLYLSPVMLASVVAGLFQN